MKAFLMAVFTLWQREMLGYVRDRARIISSLMQPLIFLVIFGVGLRRVMAAGIPGVDFLQFMFPGTIAMSIMGVAFFSTVSTVFDREFGFLKEILVAPVPRTAVALGKALGGTTVAAIQALILMVLAPLIGLTFSPLILPELFGLMLLLALAISGMGLLFASMMKSTESFGIVMQVFIFPMFFLSGAFFPLTTVPTWMSIVAHINPLSYAVDAFRQVLLGSSGVAPQLLDALRLHSLATDAAALVGFAVVTLTAAVWAFRREG